MIFGDDSAKGVVPFNGLRFLLNYSIRTTSNRHNTKAKLEQMIYYSKTFTKNTPNFRKGTAANTNPYCLSRKIFISVTDCTGLCSFRVYEILTRAARVIQYPFIGQHMHLPKLNIQKHSKV